MAGELVSVLGFDATQAINTLNTLNAALAQYTQSMRAAASATRAFNKAGATSDGVIKRQSNVIKGFAATTQNLNTAQEASAAAAARVSRATRDVGSAADDASKKVKKSSQTMILSWQSVIRIFLLQGIHTAITRITQALTEGAGAARAYEISLAEIQTIGRGLNLTLDGLSEEVRSISEAFGIPIETVTEGTYQTLSNQVAEAAETFQFLNSSATLALGAVTDLDSAVNLLSSVINSYNFDASDANEISGKLFKTIELGRIRGEEFANTYGRVLVLASQIGISFDEVNASMATFTVSGLRANEAMTLLTNAMLKLIRPTDALKDRMSELGIPLAEAGIQAFGFQGFLQEITKESGASASAIGTFFGRVRATRAILGLTNEQTERYVANLDAIKEAGREDIFRAQELILNVDAKQLEREIQTIRNFFTVDLGRAINSALLSISQFAGGGVLAIKALGVGVLTTTAVFLGLQATGTTAFFLLTAGATSFGNALAAVQLSLGALVTPLTLLVGASLAVGAAFVTANKIINRTSEDSLRQLEKVSAVSLDLRLNQIKDRQKAEKEANDAILSDTQKFLFDRQKLFVADQKRAARLESLVLSSFRDQVQDRLSGFEGFVAGLRDKSKEAAEAIAEARLEIGRVGRDVETFQFTRSLIGLDEGQVVARQVEQANRLRLEAQRATRARDFDRAKELQSQAQSLNDQALQSADQLDDRRAILKIERSITNTFAEQQNLQKSIILDQRKQEEIADRERASSEASLNRLQQAVRELDDLEITAFGNPEEAKAAFAEVTSRIEAEFRSLGDKVSVGDFLGLRSYINEAMEPLRDPTTGQQVRLDLLIDPNIDLIFDTLSNAWDTIPESAKLQVSDIAGESFTTASGFKAIIEGIVEVAKQNDEINKAEVERVKLEKNLQSNLQGRLTIEQSILRNLERQALFANISNKTTQTHNRLRQEQAAFIQSFAEAQRGLAEGDVDAVARQVQALTIFRSALSNQTEGVFGALRGHAAGIPGLLTDIDALIKAYNEALSLRNNLLITPPVDSNERNQQIQNLGNSVNQAAEAVVQGETVAQQANNATAITINNKTVAVERYIQSLQRANQLSTAPNTVTRNGITITRRAQGGSVGTDSVAAMLTPGEFVMNAKSTRKFFPQLMSMNAGVKPIFRQDGGSVTNVGDVNISVTGSAEPRQTARETMRAFQRVLRRDG